MIQFVQSGVGWWCEVVMGMVVGGSKREAARGGLGTSPCTAPLLNLDWQADFSPGGSVGRNLTVAWQ